MLVERTEDLGRCNQKQAQPIGPVGMRARESHNGTVSAHDARTCCVEEPTSLDKHLLQCALGYSPATIYWDTRWRRELQCFSWDVQNNRFAKQIIEHKEADIVDT